MLACTSLPMPPGRLQHGSMTEPGREFAGSGYDLNTGRSPTGSSIAAVLQPLLQRHPPGRAADALQGSPRNSPILLLFDSLMRSNEHLARFGHPNSTLHLCYERARRGWQCHLHSAVVRIY